jgi:hypothetical protein
LDKDKQVISDLKDMEGQYVKLSLYRTIQNIAWWGDTKYFVTQEEESPLNQINMNSTYKTVAASNITISELMLPMHTNFSGKIHGGYILSLLIKLFFACASQNFLKLLCHSPWTTVDFERTKAQN